MMKDVIRALETGLLAEIGLIAFLLAFVLILARAFLMPKQERNAAKHMPLEDEHVPLDDEPLNDR